MGIFLHLEDELLSLESAVWDPQNPNDRFTVNTLLGGFGISQQLGAQIISEPDVLMGFNGFRICSLQQS